MRSATSGSPWSATTPVISISFALAADHRDRVDRLVVAEVPGPPLLAASPPLFGSEPGNNKLWHIPFNRVNNDLIVDMVRGNADAFYRYVELYTRDKDALRATFGLYRAWDADYHLIGPASPASNRGTGSRPFGGVTGPPPRPAFPRPTPT